MELTFGSSFTVALLSCLYISLITCPVVTAKCHGRWAIHACFGGNGKRSDPNMSPSTDELPPTLLRQLLVSDVQRLSRLLREPEAPVEDADLSPNPGFEPGQSNEQLMPRLAAPEPVDETTLSRLENYRQMLKNRYFRWKGFWSDVIDDAALTSGSQPMAGGDGCGRSGHPGCLQRGVYVQLQTDPCECFSLRNLEYTF